MPSLSELWAELEREAIPPAAPANDRDLARLIFYATSVQVLKAMFDELDRFPSEMVAVRAMAMLEQFRAELEVYAREMVGAAEVAGGPGEEETP